MQWLKDRAAHRVVVEGQDRAAHRAVVGGQYRAAHRVVVEGPGGSSCSG